MTHGLSKEQIFAARPDRNVWVTASAGTGKTHVLTARVLGMMVGGTPPENILGLTYTKAAAAEMAARVYKILSTWAMVRDDQLASEIYNATGKKAGPEDLSRARTLFAQVLDIPGGLKIQTIHSFCQSLLRRFPLEAGLPPHFTVMEDRSAEEFLKQAMDDVMLAASDGGDAALKQAFDHIATREAESGFEELVAATLGKRRQVLRLLYIYSGLEGLISALYGALGATRETRREEIIEAAFKDPAFNETGLEKTTKIILEGSVSEVKIAQHLVPFFADKTNRADLFETYCQAFFTTTGDKRKPFFVKATVDNHPDLPEIFQAEQERLIKVREKLFLLQVAEDTAALIRLSSTILAAYQKAKQVHGFLDYDDLILKTSDLLSREGITPWILYKLDGRIDHILVDEAQDTNQIQWQLVEKLSEEFFSGAGAREDLFRTVFAVGDLKQSIYRFQGAEPKAFEEAKTRLAKKVKEAGLDLDDCVLNTSYRSTGPVLQAVDEIFTRPEVRSGIVHGDEVVTHIAHRLGQQGVVEVWPPERPEQKSETEPGWQLPGTQKFIHTPKARMAEKIASHIADMALGGEHLKSRGRAVRYGDILVLVKTRDEFMDHLIRELKARDIPVAGSDRMMLGNQLVIQDLIALAHHTLLPGDDFTLACVLKGPLVHFDDKDLLDLAPGREGSLWQALSRKAKTNARYQEALTLLTDLRGDTPFDYFARILGPLEGRRKFVRRLGQEVNDPLDEFLSLALDYERNHTPSLQGFLKWFASGKTEIKRDMERGKNEVRIMTIHGAKGLEAPIVYLPDTFKVVKARRTNLYEIPTRFNIPGRSEGLLVWARKKEMRVGPCQSAADTFHAEEMEEQNRLLYVALTRAADRLYIGGWMGEKNNNQPVWYDSIRTALEALKGIEKIDVGDELPLLRLENAQSEKPKPDDEQPEERKEAIKLPPWASTAAGKEAGGRKTVPPSRHDQDETECPLAGDGRAEAAKARGTIIHKLLEVLPNLPEETWQRSAKSYLAQKDKALPRNDQDDIRAKVMNILKHPYFHFLFGPDSRGEAAMAGMKDEDMVPAQIDRLVVGKEIITLVDYKSDREVPAKIEDAPPPYIRQLRLYAELLKSAFPDKKIRAALLWTETCTLMEIPEDILMKRVT